jgi:syntaxin-binding protein 1
VDNVDVPRQPSPHLAGVYFITPCDESIRALVADFGKRGQPQHKVVHVFFTAAVQAHQLDVIRGCSRLVERLATLKEINVEYALYPDNRSFTTAQETALPAFFGAHVDSTEADYRNEIKTTATRLATVFATLKEYPSIRFRAALPPGDEYPAGLESRLLVTQRLAVDLYEALAELQRAGHVPERETCELIIADRGFDPVAPIIHEWTYEAMIHDLLQGTPSLKGKVFTYKSQTQDGKTENKEHVLDEHDTLFAEVRHRHFAAASLRISSELDELRAKSRIANRGQVGEMDLRGMARLVQALPQYRDQLTQLGAHVELASLLNRSIDLHRLADLGKLEQDLVFGDATSKEVIAFLSANQTLPDADKLRLLMCYSATHQEKLDPTRQAQWQKIARLSRADMAAVTNLEYLGIPVHKRQRGALAGLSFARKRRRALRKEREPDEDDQQFSLARFVPLLAEVLEDAAHGRLSQEEYPYVRPPGSPSASHSGFGAAASGSESMSGSVDNTPRAAVASFRTVRPTTGTWAKKPSGNTPRVVDRSTTRGSMLFAFVIGGLTYSELRCAHRLTAKLGRDVLLGATNVQTPGKFLQQVMALGTNANNIAPVEIDGGSLGTSGGRRR